MEYKFSGKNLNECLDKATHNLSIKNKDINYKIVNEEKNFLGMVKKCTIEVTVDDAKEPKEEPKEEPNLKKKNSNTIKVTKDSIVIGGEMVELEVFCDPEIKLSIVNQPVQNGQKISSVDVINYKAEIKESQRILEVKASPMEARISTKYKSEYIVKPECKIEDGRLKIKKVFEEGSKGKLFSEQEIIGELKEKNVVFGIIPEVLKKATTEYNVKDLVIAKALKPVDDEDDRIDFHFEGTKRLVEEDSMQSVDYRNMYSTANVSAGDILAELIVGKGGSEGKDVYGNILQKKEKKALTIKAGQGCKIEDGSVIAIIDGQPTVKNGLFFVHKVLQRTADVDLKSGNISFTGDVKITGNIRTGMKVESGNSLEVSGNVDEATIISQGEAKIQGSIINSKVIIGSKDLSKQNYIEALEQFKEDIMQLTESVEALRSKPKLADTGEGQLIKGLMETKFKSLHTKAFMVLNFVSGEYGDQIKAFIREKLIGAGPLKIKYSSELYDLVKAVEKELIPLKEEQYIPVDLYFPYCQDSDVESTGNIYITGKGQYTSKIIAKGDIIFLLDRAVSRGGQLVSGGKIVGKVLGSNSGVETVLKVPKDGTITADIAYQNTVLWFGNSKYVFETASKQVNAFVNYEGEIQVDKFVL